jgi:hypothetical protein
MLSRALLLSIGVTTLTTSIAAAQALAPGNATAPSTTAVPSFAQAIKGQDVWISADGTRVRGRVTSIGATSLVLVEDGLATTISYKSIVRVEKSTHRLRKGTLIGLVSGAGLGLVVGAAYCGGDEWCDSWTVAGLTGYYAGLGAAAGVGIGAIVHAAKKSGDVLYDVRRSTTTMSFAPILSPTKKGMAFSMTWR